MDATLLTSLPLPIDQATTQHDIELTDIWTQEVVIDKGAYINYEIPLISDF